MSHTTTQETAADIVSRHYGNAWRARIVAEWQDQNGRYTKAKERAREIAQAREDAVKGIVDDMRAAGIEMKEN